MESIVLPPISTGIFGYSIKEATEICAIVICSYKPKHLKYRYMCILNNGHIEAIYNGAFKNITLFLMDVMV